MEFQRQYFNNEVREGFLVPSIMKKGWAAQIEVLERFDKLCTEHKFHYWIDFGSMLGAIRHGGFIPWDDDIDMSMPRKDLEELRILLKSGKTEFDAVDFYGEANFDSLLLRLVTKKEISFGEDTLTNYHGFPYVVGLDIFPVDNVPDSKKEQEKFLEKINAVRSVLYVVRENIINEKDLNILLDQLEKTFKWKFDRTHNIKNQLMQLVDYVFMSYNDMECKEQAVIEDWVKKKYTYNKFDLEDIIEVPFENIKVKVPLIYDRILQGQFKDYMRIIIESGCHDYPFFEKQRVLAYNGINCSFERREFDKENLVRKPYVKDKSEKIVLLEKYALLCKITAMMFKLINFNEKEKVFDLLNDAQDSAIQLGSYIEINYKNEEVADIIELLEQYCEVIYEISCTLENNSAEGTELAEIINLTSRIVESISGLIVQLPEESDVYKVLLVSGKSEYFRVFRKLYNSLKDKEDIKVIVLNVSSFYRDEMGKLCDEHLDEDYEDDINIIDYKLFDFDNNRVDIAITCNPYDEFDLAGSINPIYYISNMQKMAQKIIYVSPYEIDEFYDMDQKAAANMNYYIKVPGIVRADVIVADSDNMRNIYINALTEWAGEDTKAIWEEKVVSSEKISLIKMVRPDLDYLEEKEVETCEENPTKVIYYTNVSVLADYGCEHIERIRKNLQELINKEGEVNVIWGIDENIQVLQKLRKEIYQEFEKCVEEVKAKTNITIVTDGETIANAIKDCKKYCGDTSFYANRMRRMNRVIEIEYIKKGAK